MSESLPDWLQPYWQRLIETRKQGRFPHALLISGREGIGKGMLARQLGALLLCESTDKQLLPCGHCAACGWLQASTHPDLIEIGPEEAGKAIKVDQIRSLGYELGMTSHSGRYKVAIIEPAEAMNVNAANSLLKTLEEPTENTLLVLLSVSPGRLPATIRSRCQQLRIASPGLEDARRWLETAGVTGVRLERLWSIARGAPLKVLSVADSDLLPLRDQRLEELSSVFSGRLDPLQVAADWSADTAHRALLLDWWREWLQDLICWQQASRAPRDAEVVQKLQQIVETVDCKQLFQLVDRVNKVLISLGSGLNLQLQLEDLLIAWASLSGRPDQRANLAGR